jgi:hypothetical protein
MMIITGIVLADLDVSLSAAQEVRWRIGSVAGSVCMGLVVPLSAQTSLHGRK